MTTNDNTDNNMLMINTETKNAHLKLPNNEKSSPNFDEIFRKAIQEVPVGIVITNAQAKDNPIIYCNKTFCKLTGYNPNEVLGRNCRFLQGPKTNPETIALIRRAIEKAEPVKTLILNYRKDGSTFWNELQIYPVFNDEGRLTYFMGTQIDISTKMELFESVMNAKHEWLITADAINDLIILTDADGKIIRCNKATATFFNSDFPKLIGSSVRELFASTTFDSKDDAEDLLLVTKAEFQFTDRTGYYEISNYPITVNGNLTKRVHLVRDMTSQKEMIAQLEWLNKAIQQAFDSIVITDTNGNVEQVNKSFERKTKWKNSEIVGLNLFELYFEPSSKDIIAEIQSKVLNGQVWDGEYISKRKDGERLYEEATISPIKDEAGKITRLLHIQRDVTEKKQLEAIAEAINLSENIGYIFAGIRHEIGNPLNSAKTALNVLRKNIQQWPCEKIVEYVDRSLSEMERIEYLLQTLKSFNLYEDVELKPVRIYDFICNFVKTAQKNLEDKGIRIFFDSEEDCKDVTVSLDSRAFYHVLMNIMSNAVDALEEEETPFIRIRLWQTNSTVNVSISDNGCGMSQEQLNNLFKPFYTSKKHGTGLGLVICKKMLAKMNAFIFISSRNKDNASLNSELGAKGTTVHIAFSV